MGLWFFWFPAQCVGRGSDLPEDRKDLELYGWAVKSAIEEFGDDFIGAIHRNYERLQIEQAEAAAKEAEGIEDGE